jgi:hypothetical protein
MSTTLKPAGKTMPPPKSTAPVRTYSPLAGLLSYLVPGLGQIVQGRVGKGILFLVCIYTLFFYGMAQGHAAVTIDDHTYSVNSPVYLPDSTEEHHNNHNEGASLSFPVLAQNLYNRPQFVGQFWAGVVAWPAIWQYLTHDKNAESKLRDLEQAADQAEGDEKTEKLAQIENLKRRIEHGDRLFGNFERQPTAEDIAAVQTSSGKRLELAWVFTVIAGVLNIMVIYDAIAGPAFPIAGQLPPQRAVV